MVKTFKVLSHPFLKYTGIVTLLCGNTGEFLADFIFKNFASVVNMNFIAPYTHELC